MAVAEFYLNVIFIIWDLFFSDPEVLKKRVWFSFV